MKIRVEPVLLAFALLASACGGDTAGVATPNNQTIPDMGMEDTSCDSNTDCTDPDVCVFDLATGEGTCGPAAGAGQTGDACTMGSDCASGLCIDGLCADPCAGEEDCPAGYTCEATEVDLSGGETATIDVCVPETTTCNANGDCADPDVCVIDRSGDEVDLSCDPPVGGGVVGDPCAMDDECESNLCLDDLCTAPCETSNDCATDGSFICEIETVSTGGGSDDVSVCKPRPADQCLSDADCSAADRCIASKTATDLEFSCGDPNAGGGESGDACSADTDCAQNLCVDGTCAGPCQEVGDCGGSPDRCEVTMVDLGNGNTDSGQICLPPQSCASIDDCDAGGSDVCYVDQGADAIDLICRGANAGGGELGQVCTGDSACANNLCIETRFRDVCVIPCDDDNDCDTAGYECGTTTVDLQGGGTADVSTCVPEALDPCTSNDDCGTGFDCAIVTNDAGDALQSACVPTTGGSPTGATCNDDDECASLACVGGFCSDPCSDDNQCANGQLCLNTTVAKDNLSGDFDVCETLPMTQCTSTDNCADGVRVCSDVRDDMGTDVAFCEMPNVGGQQLGTDCTASNQCRENICLLGISDECSVVCDKDTDCAASQVCTTYGDLNYCNTACGGNDDCGAPDEYCTIQGDVITNEIDFICVLPPGTNDLGALCADGNDCLTGLCLRTYSFTGVACTDDSQCSAGETCECPVDNPNCTVGKECATEEDRCTNICDDVTDCSGGIVGNELTSCSNSTFAQRPDGTSVAISTCARPDN